MIDVEIQNAQGFIICYSASDINTLIEGVITGERVLRSLDADEVGYCFFPCNNVIFLSLGPYGVCGIARQGQPSHKRIAGVGNVQAQVRVCYHVGLDPC